jgi:hypothetical protein
MKVSRLIVFLGLGALICFLDLMGAAVRPVPADVPAKRLFILQSYESGHICGQP